MKAVFFDTETGGLRDTCPTIQIAAIAVEEWEPIDKFEVKIQFNEELAEAEALKLNSYDPEVWRREAIPQEKAIRKFCDFLRRHSHVQKVSQRSGKPYQVARLAGHNVADFDAPRIRTLCNAYDIFFPADYHALDTLQLALWHLPGEPSYKLTDLCNRLGIVCEDAHDAFADAAMSFEVAKELMQG